MDQKRRISPKGDEFAPLSPDSLNLLIILCTVSPSLLKAELKEAVVRMLVMLTLSLSSSEEKDNRGGKGS